MQKKLAISLSAFFLIVGCAVPTKKSVSEKWVGHNISEAISEMGPPQGTTHLPGGTIIYMWEQIYGSANAVSRATCRTGLHVNSDGRIIDASQISESLLCR